MELLFWLLIFLLPIQLGRHFWPDWSYVFGLKIDYLSPTVYLTDLLVLLILSLWGIKNLKLKIFLKKNFKTLVLPVVVFGFFLLNAFLAQNQGAAFYKFFKLIEFILLGVWVAHQKIKLARITLPLSLAVVYSFLIALFQFLKQKTLGGVFYWLGERSFSMSTPGIAKAVFQGRLLLRPYATFPHPNVWAGFVLISLVLIFASKKTNSMPEQHGARKIERILKWPTFVLGIASIALSFSRSAWVGGALVVLLFVWLTSFVKTKNFLVLLIIFGLVAGLCQSVLKGESFFQRVELNKVAFQMVKSRSLIGVGLNNFIPQLPYLWSETGFTYWFQPVHNIYLLIAAETGIVGLLIFLWFLFLTFKKLAATKNIPLIIVLSTILFLGLFDHYWLTLQQTQLLFTIILGLSWSVVKDKSR